MQSQSAVQNELQLCCLSAIMRMQRPASRLNCRQVRQLEVMCQLPLSMQSFAYIAQLATCRPVSGSEFLPAAEVTTNEKQVPTGWIGPYQTNRSNGTQGTSPRACHSTSPLFNGQLGKFYTSTMFLLPVKSRFVARVSNRVFMPCSEAHCPLTSQEA